MRYRCHALRCRGSSSGNAAGGVDDLGGDELDGSHRRRRAWRRPSPARSSASPRPRRTAAGSRTRPPRGRPPPASRSPARWCGRVVQRRGIPVLPARDRQHRRVEHPFVERPDGVLRPRPAEPQRGGEGEQSADPSHDHQRTRWWVARRPAGARSARTSDRRRRDQAVVAVIPEVAGPGRAAESGSRKKRKGSPLTLSRSMASASDSVGAAPARSTRACRSPRREATPRGSRTRHLRPGRPWRPSPSTGR